MARGLYKKIWIPIYDKSIHICICSTIKEANALLKRRKVNETFQDGDLDAKAIVSLGFNNEESNYGAVVVFTPEGTTHGTIAHEVDHIVHDLLKAIGMKRTKASEEAYSYLQEYIVTQIIKVIKSKGVQIINQ